MQIYEICINGKTRVKCKYQHKSDKFDIYFILQVSSSISKDSLQIRLTYLASITFNENSKQNVFQETESSTYYLTESSAKDQKETMYFLKIDQNDYFINLGKPKTLI